MERSDMWLENQKSINFVSFKNNIFIILDAILVYFVGCLHNFKAMWIFLCGFLGVIFCCLVLNGVEGDVANLAASGWPYLWSSIYLQFQFLYQYDI